MSEDELLTLVTYLALITISLALALLGWFLITRHRIRENRIGHLVALGFLLKEQYFQLNRLVQRTENFIANDLLPIERKNLSYPSYGVNPQLLTPYMMALQPEGAHLSQTYLIVKLVKSQYKLNLLIETKYLSHQTKNERQWESNLDSIKHYAEEAQEELVETLELIKKELTDSTSQNFPFSKNDQIFNYEASYYFGYYW